jgi:hypothetical protein
MAGLSPDAAAQVLYRAPHRILGLAATDRQLAWAEQGTQPLGCFRIMRKPPAGAPTPLTRCRPFGNLGAQTVTDVGLLSTRVFWGESDIGTSFRSRVVYTATGVGTRRRVLTLEEPCGSGPCSPSSSGQVPGPMTTGHGALYYSVFAVSVDAMGNETVTGGSVHRALVAPGAGIRHPRLPGAPGAALLAQAAGRLAVVPADTSTRALRPLPALELRNDRTGALLWSRPVTGTIEALALSRRIVVALVDTAGDQSIRIYRPGTGRLSAVVEVHRGVIAIACSGTRLVYAKARHVFFRHRTGIGSSVTARIANSRFRISDLEIIGHVVTWHGRRTIRGVHV